MKWKQLLLILFVLVGIAAAANPQVTSHIYAALDVNNVFTNLGNSFPQLQFPEETTPASPSVDTIYINSANHQFGCVTTTNANCLNGDTWIPITIPAANDVATVAGSGWSTDAACGNAATLIVRNGSNVSTGYYQFAASQNACGQLTIPSNWDSGTLPWVQVNFTQSGATSGQTIQFQIQIGCPTTTDDPSFQTAQSFTSTTTNTTANFAYFHTMQLNSTSMTSCGQQEILNWRLVSTSGTNGTPNAQQLTFYFPVSPATAPINN